MSILVNLGLDLKRRGKIDIHVVYMDGSFAAAKKGSSNVGMSKRGKGAKIMAITDRNGLLVFVSTHSASPHEVTLVEETLSRRLIRNKPKRIIADKAYDSDKLDMVLKKKGIESIAPHKDNRIKKKTQDGRSIRRYKIRWKIESFFA